MSLKHSLCAIFVFELVFLVMMPTAMACIGDSPPLTRSDYRITLASNRWSHAQAPLKLMPRDLVTVQLPSGTEDQWSIYGLDREPTLMRTLSLQELMAVRSSEKINTEVHLLPRFTQPDLASTTLITLGTLRPGVVKLVLTKQGSKVKHTLNFLIEPRPAPVQASPKDSTPPARQGEPVPAC